MASEYLHRALALGALAICAAGLVATHYYAVLVIGILAAAALVDGWRARRTDWMLLFCCIVPPVAVLTLLRGAITQQRAILTHYFARGNLLSFDHGYDELAIDPLVLSVALILVLGAVLLRLDDGKPPMEVRNRGITPNDIGLALGLLLLPVVGAVVTQFVTHAYVPRYFLPAAAGFSLCVCYGTRWFSGLVPSLALLLILALSLGFSKSLVQQITRPTEILPSISPLAADTPILFDTPANYAQMYYYHPEMRHQLWVIADAKASLHYRYYDTDDKIMLALADRGRAQTVALRDAVRQWPKFRLVPRSADYVWALKCLMESGATIAVKQPFGPSNFIFDISVDRDHISKIDACEQIGN